jgi:tRNA nucleotidyltransferase (CCA-adding enzyme)
MDLITTHLNADFDALGAMIAAGKLYPGARLAFSGAQEPAMRDFFLKAPFPPPEIARPSQVRLEQVTRLILVDTKHPSRIGRFAELLESPAVEIHIYDHHPCAPGDIRGTVEVLEPVGATTTLFVERLKKGEISLTAEEATLLALGIYEETGSFTHVSTTPRDIEAAAWLLSQGARIALIADFIHKELTPEQLDLLHELHQSARSYQIGAVRVVFAVGSLPTYLPDLALVAHRLRDMENLDVLFTIVRMEDRVYLVARSRIPEVDVGEIAAELGGGGHPTAASAAIKDLSLAQAEERVLDLLKQRVHPQLTAGAIMTRPVKTIAGERTLREAGEEMTRYGVNVLPVLEGERFAGLITREVVQKALFHGLGDHPATELMTTEVTSADPSTPIARIEALMIERHQRFLPVLKEGQVVGAITRTDLLRSLHEELLRKSGIGEEDANRQPVSHRNVTPAMERMLPPRVREVLRQAGDLADALGVGLYLVGGIVRDILLGQENWDVDLVLEGDAIYFAQRLAEALGARVRSHQKFGTAVVIFPDGLKLDLATARTEYYEAPAALPTVEVSSLKKDLYRRDFTINALALRLNRKQYGQLIDYFGGQRDLKEGVVRVLHNLSFVEDPTRVFRAIRFEQRFGFKIGRHTQRLIASAVKMDLFHKLSGARLLGELESLFAEAEPAKVLRRMDDFDLFRFIHPALRLTPVTTRLFEGLRETLAWHRIQFPEEAVQRWYLYLLALLDSLSDDALREVCARLCMPGRLSDRFLQDRARIQETLAAMARSAHLLPSAAYALLHPVSLEGLLFAMTKTTRGESRRVIAQYLSHLRNVRPLVTGRDLQALGIPPGPRFRQILDRLLDARLDGEVQTPEQERALVQHEFLAAL